MTKPDIHFSGVKPGPDHYLGKMQHGCPVDDPDVRTWSATIGGSHWNFRTHKEVVLKVKEMLRLAYQIGRADREQEIKRRVFGGGDD